MTYEYITRFISFGEPLACTRAALKLQERCSKKVQAKHKVREGYCWRKSANLRKRGNKLFLGLFVGIATTCTKIAVGKCKQRKPRGGWEVSDQYHAGLLAQAQNWLHKNSSSNALKKCKHRGKRENKLFLGLFVRLPPRALKVQKDCSKKV